LKTLSTHEWIAFDRQSPAPTFFARPAWALALASVHRSLEPAPLVIEVNGRRYLLPTMRTQSRLRFREHAAFAMGGYTCVLDERGIPADAETAAEAIGIAARETDHLRLIYYPLAPAATALAANAVQSYETAVVDCRDGFDAALARVRGVTRRMAGQAQRRGVVVERAAPGELDCYYEILQEASIGWGLARPPITRELLQAVFDYGGDDAQLWFARVDGVNAGGGVILYGKNELFFWSAAMRREYGTFRPSNALNLRLIAAACERGVPWYNLGASEGLEGVARFKHDLGAESVIYHDLEFRRPAFALYQRLRSRVRAFKETAS
jgi:CelD/BcsL family acetyltransferase involved in cellulose biosynthesis